MVFEIWNLLNSKINENEKNNWTFIKGACHSEFIKTDQRSIPPEINSVKAILPVQIWILVIKLEAISHWLEVTTQSPPTHHSLHTCFSLRKRDQQHISLTFPVNKTTVLCQIPIPWQIKKMPPSQHSRRWWCFYDMLWQLWHAVTCCDNCCDIYCDICFKWSCCLNNAQTKKLWKPLWNSFFWILDKNH